MDDEPKICRTLAEHFAYNGYEVRNVLRGEEALALLQAYHPDVVLLDLLMPDMDGIETLKRLKRQQPAVKVIMVSAADSEQVAQGALQLGADFYVTKPFDLRQLSLLVDGILPPKKR